MLVLEENWLARNSRFKSVNNFFKNITIQRKIAGEGKAKICNLLKNMLLINKTLLLIDKKNENQGFPFFLRTRMH